jgi:FdrA protein
VDDVYFAASFDETARLAVSLADSAAEEDPIPEVDFDLFTPTQRYLRGLFSGGTLAYEALLILQSYVPRVFSNVPLDEDFRLADSLSSREHTILDLGEDEFTVGRLHPMMDNDLRIRRLEAEAGDPAVAVILLDVVLGYGAHPDPASELAPAIARVCAQAREAGRQLQVVAVVTGTDEDPQGMESQVQQLRAAGVKVFTSNDEAVRFAGRMVRNLDPQAARPAAGHLAAIDPATLNQPVAAINVGLEIFSRSLSAQGAQVIQVDWRPPASGNEKLAAILERMKNR